MTARRHWRPSWRSGGRSFASPARSTPAYNSSSWISGSIRPSTLPCPSGPTSPRRSASHKLRYYTVRLVLYHSFFFLGCVYHLSQVRNTFQYPLSKRVKTEERRVSPPNQNSFAFIICKNHPESRLETLILRQKFDDKAPLVFCVHLNWRILLHVWQPPSFTLKII